MTAPPWRPSVTVAAVIERDGRFLLVEEEANGKIVLNQPAGHLDPGESLVDACARETLEETAHRFTPQSLVGIYRWVYAPEGVTYFRFAFAGRVDGVEQGRALDREILRLHWFTPEEVRARTHQHRSPLLQRCIDDYLAGRRFPLDVISAEYA
jgi:8-oxo-dGTP pyrophosphatase MutT (NUDIX family)